MLVQELEKKMQGQNIIASPADKTVPDSHESEEDCIDFEPFEVKINRDKNDNDLNYCLNKIESYLVKASILFNSQTHKSRNILSSTLELT